MTDQKKAKIVFWGTPDFAVPYLSKLVERGFEVACVVTQKDKPVGRKKEITPPPVKKLAQKLNIPVLQPDKLDDDEFLNNLKSFEADLFVLAAYGKIISKQIIEMPKKGFVNVHPSLLPKLRGASPIQYAILENLKTTGVSIMLMDERMDHGPILAQKEISLTGRETYMELIENLKNIGSDLLIKTVPLYLSGDIMPLPQNHSLASYTKIITKEMGRVDLGKDDPAEIEKKIRALSPWPGVWTIYKQKRLKILAAHLENNQLILDQVQLEGKKPVSWKNFTS